MANALGYLLLFLISLSRVSTEKECDDFVLQWLQFCGALQRSIESRKINRPFYHTPKHLSSEFSILEGGRLILASASSGLGFIKAIAISRKANEPIELIADLQKDRTRLESVSKLFEQGKIKPVIDRKYPFNQITNAIDYVATKRARGKAVVNISTDVQQ